MKKITIILFIIMTTLLFGTNVNAVESIVLNSDKTEVTTGEEIIISINLNQDESNLVAYTAKLSYDHDVFDVIEAEDFQEQDNWSDITYNKSNNKYALVNKNGISNDKILQIKLKVKENAVPGKTDIAINSVTASNGEKDVSLNGDTIEVMIINDEVEEENITSDKKQESSSEENITIETKKNNSWLAYILIAIIILIIIVTACYCKKISEESNSQKKRNIILIMAILIVIILLIIVINLLSNKKADVNYDGKVDYDDTKDIIEYLLEIKNPEEDEKKLSDKDLNNDGQITITDVAISTSQSNNQNSTNTKKQNNNNNNTEKTNNSNTSNNSGNLNNQGNNNQSNNFGDIGGTVKPDNSGNIGNPNEPSNPEIPDNPSNPNEKDPSVNGFISKNMTITSKVSSNDDLILSFENDFESYYNVRAVKINDEDKEYPVQKDENGKYTVVLPKGKKGKNVIKIKSVLLENGLEEQLNKDFEYIFLKDIPTIENIEVNKNDKNLNVQVESIDEDEAIKNIVVKVKNKEGTIISTQELENKTSASIEIEVPGTYTIEVEATYDLGDGIEQKITKTYNKEITESTKASITKAEVQNYYVEKGENVNIKYTFESNNSSNLTGININNTFYSATLNEDGTYTVSMPAETTGYGEKTFEVKVAIFGEETVILENTVKADYYVLKNEPSIDNFVFNEFVKEQTLSFNFINDEKVVLNNANIIIVNEQGQEALRKELVEGENTVELKTLPNGKYTVKLSGTYDRDDEKENNQNEENLVDIFEPKEIYVTSEYTANLSITNVEIKNQLKEVQITFESTNSSNLQVKQIILSNGEKIDVQKQQTPENTYIATIPYQNEEKQTITINAVVVEYDIEIDLSEEENFDIFKIKPTVTDIKTSLNETTLHVEFKFNDTESIAENSKVVVKNSKGDIVGSKDITKDMVSIEIPEITTAGTYFVQFLSDFNCMDGKTHNQEKISPQEDVSFEVEITPTITLSNISNYYPKKGEQITLTYNITANTDEPITEITVDDISYPITESNYTISVNAPTKYGEKTFTLTNIKVGSEPINIVNEQAKIYVLKDEPKIDSFELNGNERKIKFNVSNPENAIIKGKTSIQTLDGVEIQSQDIVVGENIIELKANGYEEEQEYKLVFVGTYDLDDTDDELNSHQLSEIFTEEEFQLEIKTEIAFENFSTRYPEKGEEVKITFTATSNTLIPITQIYVNGNPYDATEVEAGKYQITYKAKQNESGIEELTVDKVKHSINEIQVNTKSKKLDVLKSRPIVPSGYEIDENYKAKTVTFKFELIDKDNTLKDNQAYVSFGNFKDNEGRTKIPVKPGNNEVTFVDVTEQKVFLLTVAGDYDLDTDELNEELGQNDNYYENKAIIRTSAVLLPPSILEVENIKALNLKTGEESSYINKNQEFKLSFTSKTFTATAEGETKPSSYYPVSAIIEGKYYELEKDGDNYITKVPLPSYTDAGKKNITIDSITLNNNEVIEEDKVGEIEVLKDRLSVENFKVDTSSGKAILTYTMSDPDNSFVSGMIVMTKKDTNEVSSININKDSSSYTLDLEEFRKYDVELKITYDLDSNDDDLNREEEIFGKVENVEIIKDYELNISDFTVLNVDKTSKTAKLQFKAENKSNYKLSFVKIDGQESYIGVGDAGENTYTFEYKIDSEKMAKKERTEIKLVRSKTRK